MANKYRMAFLMFPLALFSAPFLSLARDIFTELLPRDWPVLAITLSVLFTAFTGAAFMRFWCQMVRPADRRVACVILLLFVFFGATIIKKGSAWNDFLFHQEMWLWVPTVLGALREAIHYWGSTGGENRGRSAPAPGPGPGRVQSDKA